jgi:hypothetical protein
MGQEANGIIVKSEALKTDYRQKVDQLERYLPLFFTFDCTHHEELARIRC